MFPWTTIGFVGVTYSTLVVPHPKASYSISAEDATHLGSMRPHYVLLSVEDTECISASLLIVSHHIHHKT